MGKKIRSTRLVIPSTALGEAGNTPIAVPSCIFTKGSSHCSSCRAFHTHSYSSRHHNNAYFWRQYRLDSHYVYHLRDCQPTTPLPLDSSRYRSSEHFPSSLVSSLGFSSAAISQTCLVLGPLGVLVATITHAVAYR
jgi:hypothetical protein